MLIGGDKMLRKEKVSVIVPIYNVEQYLRECLDSIMAQTYKNIEIILINDGSLDQSGAIADEYKEKDKRIKLIHKENGGLSDARNQGMREATGEYTMFVDSDDWLNTSTIETMLNACISLGADVVQSAFYYAYPNKLLIDHRYLKKKEHLITLTKQELMGELVRNHYVKNFAWGKLYKTELIKDIPFKKGVLFEDVFWAHQVMHHVQKYTILHDAFYYYRQRDDSIVASYSIRNLDMIRGLKERHIFIKRHYATLTSESYKNILKMNLIHYDLLEKHNDKDMDKSHRKEIQAYIQTHYENLKQSAIDEPNLRRQLFLFSIHPHLNRGFLRLKSILRRMKVLPNPVELKQVNL